MSMSGRYIFNVVYILFFVFAVSCNNRDQGDAFYSKLFEDATKIYSSGHHEEAIRHIDSVFNSRHDAGPYFQYKRYFLKKQYYFYDRQMYDVSYTYIDSMLFALENGNITKAHPYEYAMALNAKGDYYYYANDLDKAFEFYYKSRNTAPDTCAYANQTYHLGLVTYRQEKYNDAAAYFQQSLKENKSCGSDSISFYRVQELLNNIALCYTQMKNFDSASLYYSKALNYISTESRQYGATVREFSEKASGVIYGNIAKLFVSRNMNDTAEKLLLRSIAINNKPGYDNNDAMLAQLQLADLYNNTGRLAEAIVLLDDIGKHLDSMPNPNVELKRTHLLYKYYNGVGIHDLAFRSLQDYTKLKDSLGAVTSKLNQTNVNQFLKNLETEYQLKLLTKDNEVNRLYLAITVGLSVLTIIIIVMVYVNYRKTRDNVVKLTVLNHQIKEQKEQLEYAMTELKKINGEKDRILYIVAHDLKSPISGILALSENIMDDEADELHKKSLAVISSTSMNSLKLIDRLLEFGVENINRQVKDTDVTDLNELAEQVTVLLHFHAISKRQKISLSVDQKPVMVRGIKEKIWRGMRNFK